MKIIARRFWGFRINWLTNCLSPYVTSVPCNFGEVESWNLTCTTINHFSTDFLNNQRFQFSVGQFGCNFPISILGEQTHAFKKLNCIFNRNNSNTLKCMPVQSTCCFNKNVFFVGLKYLNLRFPYKTTKIWQNVNLSQFICYDPNVLFLHLGFDVT